MVSFQLLSVFTVIYIATAESRYPYEDSYAPGDIVRSGYSSRYPYDRDSGYARKHRRGGYSGVLPGRNSGYGRHSVDSVWSRDNHGRDYRRRHRDQDYYLPPRGIGGGYSKQYDRDYGYGSHRTSQAIRPPKYYDEDEINHGGYRGGIGIAGRI